ncbi:hypothetical protein AVEN_127794-1 [Araneus ventricosus]|uniref:Mos1 transposase HTH domain-containing protein n=1 Tax=Araneus ventricosus TaxID=182803 RepID=A0A4Y2DQ35_ARAVE|nr:hypothetical protein AVEN_127794-1 [Araneus ventricosus]
MYGENITSEGMVRKWVRAFKDARTNAHDEERSGRPFVITEDSVHEGDGKVSENRCFTISSLSNELSQDSRSVLYGIVTEHLNYREGSGQISMRLEFKSWLYDATNALIFVKIMSKSRLKYRLSCKNKTDEKKYICVFVISKLYLLKNTSRFSKKPN